MFKGKMVELVPSRTVKSYRRKVDGIVLVYDMPVIQDALVSTGLA